MHHTPQTCPSLDQSVAAELPQQGFCCPAPLGWSGLRCHALAIEPLQRLVGGQGNLHQTDQRLDTPRRLEKYRADGQRGLPLVVAQLHIILLLVLGEQRVAAVLPWRRRQQRRQPVVLRRGGCGGLVERIVEAVRGSATAPTRWRQSGLLRGRQREHLPAEERRGGPVAEQFGHAPGNGGLGG